MGDPAENRYGNFTYRHYRTWPDEERWELIDGVAYSMSPAPLTRHQEAQLRLLLLLGKYFDGKPCRLFGAPFDVLLPKGDESDDEIDTVVQPDIAVFCDRAKITKRGARGAPDLVVEVLSPSTSKKDQKEKFELFERAGVREYWIVDPGNASIWVFHRKDDGRYDDGELREQYRDFHSIESRIFPGLAIEPEKVFADLD